MRRTTVKRDSCASREQARCHAAIRPLDESGAIRSRQPCQQIAWTRARKTRTIPAMGDLENNKALIRAHFDAIWSGDDDAIRAQLSDDFVDHAGQPGAPKGLAGVVEWARGMRAVFPDLKVTIEQAVAEGDRVAVFCTWRGTHRAPFLGVAATQRAITFTGMVFWRIANRKIVERWATLDIGSLMRQLQAGS